MLGWILFALVIGLVIGIKMTGNFQQAQRRKELSLYIEDMNKANVQFEKTLQTYMENQYYSQNRPQPTTPPPQYPQLDSGDPGIGFQYKKPEKYPFNMDEFFALQVRRG